MQANRARVDLVQMEPLRSRVNAALNSSLNLNPLDNCFSNTSQGFPQALSRKPSGLVQIEEGDLPPIQGGKCGGQLIDEGYTYGGHYEEGLLKVDFSLKCFTLLT